MRYLFILVVIIIKTIKFHTCKGNIDIHSKDTIWQGEIQILSENSDKLIGGDRLEVIRFNINIQETRLLSLLTGNSILNVIQDKDEYYLRVEADSYLTLLYAYYSIDLTQMCLVWELFGWYCVISLSHIVSSCLVYFTFYLVFIHVY